MLLGSPVPLTEDLPSEDSAGPGAPWFNYPPTMPQNWPQGALEATPKSPLLHPIGQTCSGMELGLGLTAQPLQKLSGVLRATEKGVSDPAPA